MNTDSFKFLSNATLAALCVVVCLVPSLACAAPWRLGANLTLAEQYTDNVSTASASDKQSAMVTEIRPGINVDRQGARIGVHADYQLQQFLYATNSVLPDEYRTFHQIHANGKFEAIPDHLFLEALSSFSQTIIDSTQPFALDNATLSNNRTNVWTYGGRSRWQNRFGQFANANASYEYTVTDRQSDLVGDLVAQSFSGSLTTGSWFRRFSAAAQANAQKSDNSAGQGTVGNLNGSLQTGYWLNTDVLFGYARWDYFRNPLLSSRDPTRYTGIGRTVGFNWTPGPRFMLGASYGKLPTGDSYNVTTRWRPTQRTSLSAGAGRTTFGKTYNGTVASSSRRGSWSLSYSEDLTTQSLLAAQDAWFTFTSQPGSGVAQVSVVRDETALSEAQVRAQNAGLNFVAIQFPPTVVDVPFVRARATATTALTGRRNTVQLSIFRERHRYQELLPDDLLLGATLGWTLKTSVRSNLSASVTFQDAAYAGDSRHSKSEQGSLAYSRQLGRSVSSSLTYTHTTTETTNSPTFTQNVLRAQLAMTF